MLGNPGKKRYGRALELLLEKASIQGYLAQADVTEIYPESDRDSERFSVLMRTLRNRGIEIIKDDQDENSLNNELIESEKSPWIRQEEIDNSSKDTVSQYFKEMSGVPLLSVQDEYELAIQIENGFKAQDEVARFSSRGNQQKHAHLESIINEGLEARDILIKSNTRLVVSIAKRYLGCGVPFLDLIQEGNLGLMKAVEKFDIHRGFRFSTYATWWIRQSITRAIAVQSRTIRVPVHMSDRIRQAFRTIQNLEQKLGRVPTIEELASEMQMSVAKVQWILKVSWQPLSLDTPISDDDDTDLGAFIEDERTPSPAQSVHENMLKEKIGEVLNTLSPREARVLRLRYGLDTGTPFTLEEVGEKFGLTRERIRQIEGKALRRLRHPKRMRQLKEYI